jgi:hypothetical protein
MIINDFFKMLIIIDDIKKNMGYHKENKKLLGLFNL